MLIASLTQHDAVAALPSVYCHADTAALQLAVLPLHKHHHKVIARPPALSYGTHDSHSYTDPGSAHSHAHGVCLHAMM